MIRMMRTVNGVLVLLWILGGTVNYVQNLGDFWRAAGALFGIALWSVPFYLAWRGLGPNSTLAYVQKARRANIAYLGLMTLVFVALGAFSDKASSLTTYLPLILVILVFGIPSVLNIKALKKRKAELDQTTSVAATDHEEAHALPEAASPVSTAAAPVLPSVPQQSSNYFLRHWRGDLSLAVSYWINSGLLTAGAVTLVFVSLDYVVEGWSLRNVALTIVIALAFTLIAWFWGAVGVWRSSEKHASRGGLPVFAGLAKVAVVLGMISTAGQLGTTYLPMFQNFVPLMFGHDPLGEYQVTVLADGRSILVRGMLREGSAKAIEKVIDAAPAVTTLMLNSNGGRLAEGKQLAELVHRRGLNTYVEDVCLSACTFVFLAGKERAATPNAKIGFHLPVVPWSSSKADDGSEYMINIYRRAGLPDAFIQRVRDTPSSTMWYPTRDELIEARVITRVSLGGETGATYTKTRTKQEFLLHLRSTSLWTAIEKRFPKIFLEAVDRAWNVREAGGNDTQISNALRSATPEIWSAMRARADDAFLERLATIGLAQRKAARELSYEACALLLAGQLDITQVLPKEHAEKEIALLLEALASEPTVAFRHESGLVTRAIREATSRMPPQLMEVIANPERYTGKTELMCDAEIAFYEKALSLPPTLRAAALDGLLRQ